ncbi:flagellar hook-associated protein FlgL [Algiphilus sp.]|uniref:flagellar hook-associated protein FlgL n=1 Tax=Algiphilus sp. TaxID=1872431 RepID=UPI003B51C959
MRIASDTIYRQAVAAIQDAQSNLARVQEQLSSGERIRRSGEDPSAFTTATRLDARQELLTGFERASDRAFARLSLTESRIGEAVDQTNRVRELVVQGNNATLSSDDRAAIARELRQIREGLLQTANASDGEGRALFAGTASGKPYQQDISGAIIYQGNAGSRLVPINTDATVADGEQGPAVFGRGSNDLFAAVDAAIAAVEEPDPALRAAGAAATLDQLDARLDQMNLARGRVGARLSAIEQSAEVRAVESEQLTVTRANLMDTDIAQAITDLTLTGNRLSAAQQSYLQVQRQSLFDLIR